MTASSLQGYQARVPAACTNATGGVATGGIGRAPPAPARGILHLPAGVTHGRIPPSAHLARIVEHYWWVRWDLDAPASSEVLSYPSLHVVFERDEARIVGVVREKFVRRLEGQGQVFGMKFRPAMFHAISRVPAFRLTGRTVPLGDELGDPGLAAAVADADSAATRARLVDQALTALAPTVSPRAQLAGELVERIRTDVALRTVRDLAADSRLSERVLQRLFREFVGVSPKWVVRRFRLQEAAALLEAGRASVASVAAQLGYFDQAHFVHDWTSVVGKSPTRFVREASASR